MTRDNDKERITIISRADFCYQSSGERIKWDGTLGTQVLGLTMLFHSGFPPRVPPWGSFRSDEQSAFGFRTLPELAALHTSRESTQLSLYWKEIPVLQGNIDCASSFTPKIYWQFYVIKGWVQVFFFSFPLSFFKDNLAVWHSNTT